jgi:hypothetical protein
MEPQQMAMPAEMAAQGPNPEEMAIYDRMRQEISPQEFSNEMLAGASQVDPQAVAEFTQELQGLDMPPEVLDALNDVVDEILANPERYDELRAQYMEQGLPEDILPEQFDPQFFAALNMAIDQMIAAPTGVQAFAAGGIAELKPIAKAIASYGRNGDTMLAHITPAEARMLRRRGGSGTINPKTGLPEFFLKKLFKGIGKALKSVGRAVKKFANSTVGRLVTTVALGFFLGPMAVQAMGLASGSMAAAAVTGFVGGAGSSLLAGGNLKDALKSGAIAGLTAGAAAGLGGASLTGAPVVDAPMAVPGAGADAVPGAGAVPGAPAISATGEVAGMTPAAPVASDSMAYNLNMQAQEAAANAPAATSGSSAVYDPATATRAVDFGYKPGGTDTAPAYRVPTVGESFSKMGEGLGMGDKPASFDTFKQGATDLFSPSPTNEQLKLTPEYADAMSKGKTITESLGQAAKANAPGMLRTYGPAAVAGLGTLAAFGGFDTKPVEGGDITKSLMKPVTQRIREDGTQRQMYMQNLPGVVYDEYGEPVFGKSTRLPTYDVPDYDYGGFNNPGQGIMNLPQIYTPPEGTIGSRSVNQPYNNSDMYSNIMPRRYADGGTVTDLYRSVLRRDPSSKEIDQYKTEFGDTIDERERAVFRESVGSELASQRSAMEAERAKQEAARDAVAQKKAMRRAAGSGAMYANINAGLAALAPETNPMDAGDTTFGARNRQAQFTNLEQAYNPMLQGQRNAMNQQAAALGQRPITTMPVGLPPVGLPPPAPPTGIDRPITISPIEMPGGYSRPITEQFFDPIKKGVTKLFDGLSPVRDVFRNTSGFDTGGSGTQGMNMGGIAGLAQGGYPRRNGQISGPGTEKSDSIPAMLSDGEFVMTAKAVRGAGKGSRRAGAKQMYKLMHQLEKNAERG